MKVSELSERAGVPLATIKFYIREGLLPGGHRTSRNQAEYSEAHLERLALIRALRDDACLSVAAIARALGAADAARDEFIQAAVDAIQRPAGPPVHEQTAAFKQAKAEVLQLSAARGWRVQPSDNAVREAARALTVIRRSFPSEDEFAIYADVAEQLAKYELPESWEPSDAPEAALRYAMLGTILFEPFLLALRRMAHTARSRSMASSALAQRDAQPASTAKAKRATTRKKKRARGVQLSGPDSD